MAKQIPDQLVQDIIAANDIVSLVGQYVPLRRSGSSYVGLCPFHKEKTPSFHVTPDRQLYYCFGCGAGGNSIKFVENIEHLDFVEAVRFLADRAGIRIDTQSFSEADQKRYEQRQRYLQMNKDAARFYRDCLFSADAKTAQEYVRKRGLGGETVKTYGIGYAPDEWDALTKHLLSAGYAREELVQAGLSSFTKTGKVIDRFRDRLMFPIIDVRGNVIGFGGRILGEGNVKYLNSPETPVFNKGQNLFSLQLAKRSKELILVEGYMDVISLYQAGIQNAVASLGTALTAEQARLAAKYAEKVTICYDTDGAGVKAAMRAIEVFEGIDVRLRVLSLPEGKDPDEFIKANGAVKFSELLQKADTPAAFQIRQLRKQYTITDEAQRIEYVEACTKVISAVGSSVEREVLRQRLAEETGIGSSAIEAEVEKKRNRKKKSAQWNVKTPGPKVPAAIRSHTADKIISLCLKDKTVYQKYKEELSDVLEAPVHKKILELLAETDDAAQITARFENEESAIAAAALSMPVNYEKNDTAMRELMEALRKESYNQKVKEAIESGDISMLNSLLMKKNVKEEGGC
ncbi:MAG: DNA primase [Ruminococcaceae bacterium]|nr:DNA primase [Oscillospiraceae bacterium]